MSEIILLVVVIMLASICGSLKVHVVVVHIVDSHLSMNNKIMNSGEKNTCLILGDICYYHPEDHNPFSFDISILTHILLPAGYILFAIANHGFGGSPVQMLCSNYCFVFVVKLPLCACMYYSAQPLLSNNWHKAVQREKGQYHKLSLVIHLSLLHSIRDPGVRGNYYLISINLCSMLFDYIYY